MNLLSEKLPELLVATQNLPVNPASAAVIRDLPRDSFMVMSSAGDPAWIDTQELQHIEMSPK